MANKIGYLYQPFLKGGVSGTL